jgi:hypothetical protein
MAVVEVEMRHQRYLKIELEADQRCYWQEQVFDQREWLTLEPQRHLQKKCTLSTIAIRSM